MTLLTISLLAPFFGPLLLLPLRHEPRVAAAVDGFVLVAMAGLVGLHALPESIAQLGWPAVLAAIVGLLLPKLAHGAHPPPANGGRCDHPTRTGWIGLLAAAALLTHAFADGIGLLSAAKVAELAEAGRHAHTHAHAHAHHDHAWLPFAVALHRLVEGTSLWWLLRGRRERWVRWGALVVLACATLAGRLSAGLALAHGFAPVVALVQASVAGSLLHVLLWHAPALPTAPKTGAWSQQSREGPAAALRSWLTPQAASACGGAAATGLLLAFAASEHALSPLVAQLHAALPLLARTGLGVGLGLALAAWGHAGAGVLLWAPNLAPRGRLRAACAGARQGLTTVACSCGVLPLVAGLRRRGATAAYLTAFAVAAPALGLVGAALSFVLFGFAFTGLRIVGVLLLASLAGYAAGRGGKGHSFAAASGPAAPATAGPAALPAPLAAMDPPPTTAPQCVDGRGRLADGLHFAGGEVLDFTGPWLLCGLVLAAAVARLLPANVLPELAAQHLDVPILTVLAAPLYLCASASTLVAAALLHRGASVGGVLAFCWAASSLSPALWSTWRQSGLQGTRLGYTAVLLGGAWAGGALVNAAADQQIQSVAAVMAMDWAGWLDRMLAAAPLQSGCLAVLVAVVVRALWRQGIRGASAQLASSNRLGPASRHHAKGI